MAFGLGASAAALLPRTYQCCFGITASGGASGTLGQLSDGQNRIGGGYGAATYCISNGAITDSNGRGCILTPPTTQFQCDTGATAQTGFSIDSSGQLSYNGNQQFYACPVNDYGEYNVYTTPVPGQTKCVEIALSTGGKCSSAPAPPPPKSSAPAPTPSSTGSKCPADINGNYQFPHLIVPVDSSQPSKAFGTSYFGEISSTVCSTFNFDIPQSYSGATCSLVFLFPEQSQLVTSSFTLSGSGGIDFSKLSGPVSQSTSWSNCPAKESDYGTVNAQPGNSYVVWSGACPAGQTVAYELCGTGSFSLNYFQDYNPSPIGLYMREC
ncbi:hypothetical protein K432DRAFT_298929 [Lepidopterella palustris CBS 459.81]|uniref:Ubiquitin 3 binding protein But2 C-terminal domain-containing protein n=1 Tax=Lepidopterella palustris CBS 459.81 TaxID=1314670 RepID=A0A8E2E9R4_9PEZI|nr:hypothetical protein K432DRAFT_298929 [Lepidopterella palustris CBS 459.81]